MTGFPVDQPVRHPRHGEGRVVADLGATVVVRFDAGLEQVEASELELIRSFPTALAEGRLDDPLEVLARAQALAIRSVNDQWGVFSRSRIELLPHQLWVCRQVTRTWPARWLVADDVGLGKTIEAGLILEPLLASGRVRRVLVLAPARLVPQWRTRLKTMFDIRLQEYSSELDRGTVSFWETAQQVVASFHTLRQERARERLLAAEPWDLVMVDEAHHFQADERTTTLTYQLLRKLEDAGRIRSLVLFTGTPHRGKDHGFLALMQLVRPDLFAPERDVASQLPLLRRAMIRNNKALVTDLRGERLFQPIHTEAVDYAYSPEEDAFYRTMSAFILDGRAYAASLTGRQETARTLLLVALQKLAASSIAAIRRALERRRELLARALPVQAPAEEAEPETLDEAAEAEEERPARTALLLLRDEIARLDELLDRARAIGEETKVRRLLRLIDERLPADEPLLLFTEYKATQALVLAALERRYGRGSVGFVNGEGRLAIVEDGAERLLRSDRETAAADFNAGRVRFLVSTEAGGEGIDLQRRCAHLVHVDLPWNPMRLHQRVGRLHRYGQSRPVRVFLLRNPATVEARIWALLEDKLARIQAALSASMDEAEDIAQLVIGMAGDRFFDELFAEAAAARPERLADWFDARTGALGGRDVLATVRALLGSVARFDFGRVGGEIPALDLPALEPFFRNAMQLHGRRVTGSAEGLAVVTPEAWRGELELRPRYDGLVFDRAAIGERPLHHLLGVGHPLLDRAVQACAGRSVFLARVRRLAAPLLIAAAEDELTGTGSTVHRIVLALEGSATDPPRALRDWQLLSRLNGVLPAPSEPAALAPAEVAELLKLAASLAPAASHLDLPFRRPKVTPVLALLPEARA